MPSCWAATRQGQQYHYAGMLQRACKGGISSTIIKTHVSPACLRLCASLMLLQRLVHCVCCSSDVLYCWLSWQALLLCQCAVALILLCAVLLISEPACWSKVLLCIGTECSCSLLCSHNWGARSAARVWPSHIHPRTVTVYPKKRGI